MRKDANNFFTASKDGYVILVDTNLSSFIRRLPEVGLVAPHRNTFDKKFAISNIYEVDGVLFQRLPAGQNDDFIASQANNEPEKK